MGNASRSRSRALTGRGWVGNFVSKRPDAAGLDAEKGLTAPDKGVACRQISDGTDARAAKQSDSFGERGPHEPARAPQPSRVTGRRNLLDHRPAPYGSTRSWAGPVGWGLCGEHRG